MKLPDSDAVTIPEAKIVRYLLSLSHPTGRSKAIFFRRFGFSPDEWEVLRESLLQHAHDHEVAKSEVTLFGTRYIIEGAIQSPDGRNPEIRAVWIVETGSDIPKFVTAYRLRRRRTRS